MKRKLKFDQYISNLAYCAVSKHILNTASSRRRVENSPPKKSLGGDFLKDGDRETFAPRQFIHDRRLSENRPYCLIVRNSPPRRRLFEWGRVFRPHSKSITFSDAEC